MFRMRKEGLHALRRFSGIDIGFIMLYALNAPAGPAVCSIGSIAL